ncbi:hypothetical protein Trydic_g16167 [Trypoxylus dichotomus]
MGEARCFGGDSFEYVVNGMEKWNFINKYQIIWKPHLQAPSPSTQWKKESGFGRYTERSSRRITSPQFILRSVYFSVVRTRRCSNFSCPFGNTTDDAATDPDGFRPPSRRQQRRRKGSANSDYDTGRKRTGAKLVPTGGTGPQPVLATAAIPKAKEGCVPPVVLREKARWTTLNTEILRRGIRTTKVVNTNVGIRIQPTTADDYRQLVHAVTALNMQFHSNQLTEDKPLKVVLRGVPEDITEDEINRDLVRQGIRVLECKRMLVAQARRPIPLVFGQLTKSDEAKGIFRITHVCGINITVESKQV